MLRQIRLLFASLVAVTAVATFAGCMTAADPAEGNEESVESAEQASIASGYYRVYYADSTYSEQVGWENYDCEPDYRSMEGEETRYYKQYRYDCPEFHSTILPLCQVCDHFALCYAVPCPIGW